jgi:dihydrofolate reductase
MRHVRYSVAMSLDGYIAGPNGESDWIVMDPDIDFSAMLRAFDTIVMGRKTFQVITARGDTGMPGMEVYVFSRTLMQSDCPDVTVSDSPEDTIRELQSEPGKDIWLFGGGSMFRSMLALNLVDSIEIAIVPVLLGGGLPLLPHPAQSTKLALVQHKVLEKTGTVWLEYARA